MQRVAGSGAPDSQAIAARRDFSVAVQRLLEHELRPDVDRAGHRIATIIHVDRDKVFLFRLNVGQPSPRPARTAASAVA